jgi:hypothetical protein
MTMKNQLRITDPCELPKLVELVHDRWLDAESIAFDSRNSTLSIRYLTETGSPACFINRVRFPAFECSLRIARVESYSVRDPQKVRFYDLNTITYDPKSMCVKLETGVPIEIQVIVSGFDLTAEETETTVQG